jgi:hypothetical protein
MSSKHWFCRLLDEASIPILVLAFAQWGKAL